MEGKRQPKGVLRSSEGPGPSTQALGLRDWVSGRVKPENPGPKSTVVARLWLSRPLTATPSLQVLVWQGARRPGGLYLPRPHHPRAAGRSSVGTGMGLGTGRTQRTHPTEMLGKNVAQGGPPAHRLYIPPHFLAPPLPLSLLYAPSPGAAPSPLALRFFLWAENRSDWQISSASHI